MICAARPPVPSSLVRPHLCTRLPDPRTSVAGPAAGGGLISSPAVVPVAVARRRVEDLVGSDGGQGRPPWRRLIEKLIRRAYPGRPRIAVVVASPPIRLPPPSPCSAAQGPLRPIMPRLTWAHLGDVAVSLHFAFSLRSRAVLLALPGHLRLLARRTARAGFGVLNSSTHLDLLGFRQAHRLMGRKQVPVELERAS